MSPSAIGLTVGVTTDTGKVRENNEDSYLVDADLGLYVVFDGMGGASAGDVASQTARDTLAQVMRNGAGREPSELLASGIQAASKAVFDEAQRRRDRRGMGTTIVAVLMTGPQEVLIAHVGDSRAYLLRDGRLQQLTRDHTIVAELLASGAISPEDAERHAYKSVLSRNLGAKPDTRMDLNELMLVAGDRLLLCSDGLNGFASTSAIEQVLHGAEDPQSATRDLIELALRGGGGDNVTAIVIEAGQQRVPQRTQMLRTSGAAAWYAQRDSFMNAAAARGVAQSPICAGLSPQEALNVVAGNLFDAIYYDLVQTTGVHVWTYADNLARGWFERNGAYADLRELFSELRIAADVVIMSISDGAAEFGAMLDSAVTRALLVGQMAVGGLLATRLRGLESLIADESTTQIRVPFADQSTTPVSTPRPDPSPPEVTACLNQARVIVDHRVQGLPANVEQDVVQHALNRAHEAALEHGGELDGPTEAQELFGARAFAESAIVPILEALDYARGFHLRAVAQVPVGEEARAVASRRLATAHSSLMFAVARLVVEVGRPITDALREASEITKALRAKVQEVEKQLTSLERKRLQTMPGWSPGKRDA